MFATAVSVSLRRGGAVCGAAVAAQWSRGEPSGSRCEAAVAAAPRARPSVEGVKGGFGGRGPLRRRLTAVGKFALLSETALNPTTPAVLLKLRGALTAAEVATALDRGFASPRFRSVVDDKALEFVEVADFATRDAVVAAARPPNVAEALVEPWDPLRPRWSATVWTEEDSKATTRVLLRAHHALVDGVSMAAVFAQCTDQAKTLEDLVQAQVVAHKLRSHRRHAGMVRSWLLRLLRLAAFLGLLLQAALRAALERATRWRRCHVRSTTSVAATTADSASVGLLPLRRSVAWAPGFADVDTLKNIAKTLGGPKSTVNDVFAAIIAGALASCLFAKGDGSSSRTVCAKSRAVSAAVPVHLYGGALPPGTSIGNHIGAVVVGLPMPWSDDGGDGDRVLDDHVRAVARDFGGTLRGGASPVLAYGAALVAGALLPRSLMPGALEWATRGVTVALTNVRGPPLDHISLAGRTVDEATPFLPPPPGIPIGCALTTLAGRATLSVNAETDVVDANVFLDHALAYYEKLLRRATSTQQRRPPLPP